MGLRDDIALLPTPNSNMANRGQGAYYDSHSKSQNKRDVNTLIGKGTGEKLRLQPAMTQWMMGFPESWTEFPIAEPNGEKKA